MEGELIPIVAICCGIGFPALAAGITVVYKLGKQGQKVEELQRVVNLLALVETANAVKIGTIEGFINGKSKRE